MKEKVLAVLCHLCGLFGNFLFPGFGGVLAILVIWSLGKSPDRALLNQHAKEVMNFYVSITIYAIITFFVAMTMFFVGGVSLLKFNSLSINDSIFKTFIAPGAIGAISMGLMVQVLAFLAVLIFVLIAIINAIDGKDCRYPLTIRLIK